MRKSRLLAVVMAVLMMISMLPAMVFAAEVPSGQLEGELKMKGAPALDVTLKADYKKVKPEGLTDDYVSFLWERKESDSDDAPLVELSKEKTYKVTSEDIGYRIVLTITGLEDKGVTGSLKVTSDVVTEAVPLDEDINEADLEEEQGSEEPVEENTDPEEQTGEEISAEGYMNEEVQSEEQNPEDTIIQETIVNEEVYGETTDNGEASGEEGELSPSDEPGTGENTEILDEELMPINEPEDSAEPQDEFVSYNAQAITPDGSGILDFGTIDAGSEANVEPQYITIRNTGTGDLNFDSLSPEHFMVEDIIETLGAGSEASVWVIPREGLEVGSYQDTITYTTEEGATASFMAAVTIQEAAAEEPVTAVTAEPDALSFDSVEEGYEAPEAQEVVITNNGSSDVTLLQPQQSNDYFEIGELSAETLAPGEQAVFTVTPKTGLPAETYQDVISVKNAADDTELVSVEVSFTVEKKTVHKLTVVPEEMTLDFGTVESGYEKAPKAQTVTISNDGNAAETLTQPVSEWFSIGEMTATELEPGEVCTFTVQPAVGLEADSYMEEIEIPNTSGEDIFITATVVVEEKEEPTVKITAIRKPSEITGLANGTAKKAETLKLPSYVVIETTDGNKKAAVAWDVKGCSYDPSATSAQTFNVKGTVTLPDGVENPDGISLVTSVKVSVNGYTSNIASADDNRITGITPNGQYTTKETISFTAVGAGMDNNSPRKGDVRYLPLSWTVINTNTWTGTPYAASFGMGRSGNYSLTVVFNRQQYDGSSWVNTGEQDTKKVSFSVVQAADPTVTPTLAPNQKSAVQTGDNTPIIPFVIALIVAIACIAGIIIYRKRNK